VRTLQPGAGVVNEQITPLAPGSQEPAAIILLSDDLPMGDDTLDAAKMAADRGKRIHGVGLGTPDGHAATGKGMAVYLQLDEPTLRHGGAAPSIPPSRP
jgi:Ca-activated chloride channel family protein